MNDLLIILALYWSDIVTGPILYWKREYEHWRDMKEMKSTAKKTKGMSTEEQIEKGYLHEFKSSDWITKMRDERKNRKFPDWVYNVLWHIKSKLWWNLLEHPENLRHWLKHAYERVTKGWSYRDVWSIDWHLSKIMPEMLERLKKVKHGTPMSAFKDSDGLDKFGGPSDKASELASKRWEKILDNMILTFKITQKIQEDHWFYQPSKTYSVTQANKMRKFDKDVRKSSPELYKTHSNHVMTKEECKVYEKGWKLFQEHYFSLWD